MSESPDLNQAPGVGSLPAQLAGLLAERGNRYGDFSINAEIAQGLKGAVRLFGGYHWKDLPATHRQSIDVILDKISRVVSGDPDYRDNWVDIQGYAQLVLDHIDKGETNDR